MGEQRPAGFGVLVDGVDFLQPEPLAQAVPDLYALVFVRNRNALPEHGDAAERLGFHFFVIVKIQAIGLPRF